MMKKLHQKKAFTLIEVLMATAILVFGILSCLTFFAKQMYTVQQAQDMSVAAMHADALLETMESYSTRSAITAEEWSAMSGRRRAGVGGGGCAECRPLLHF